MDNEGYPLSEKQLRLQGSIRVAVQDARRLLIGQPEKSESDCQLDVKSGMQYPASFARSKSGASMKAILCSQYCQPDDLVLAEIPDPVAEGWPRVIGIKAAALNFFDILMIPGKYQIKPPFPFSPAAEIAGVVESVGADVSGLKPGDRVVASCGHNGAREKIALPADSMVKFPTIWISTVPPALSSSTAPRCMRWKDRAS